MVTSVRTRLSHELMNVDVISGLSNCFFNAYNVHFWWTLTRIGTRSRSCHALSARLAMELYVTPQDDAPLPLAVIDVYRAEELSSAVSCGQHECWRAAAKEPRHGLVRGSRREPESGKVGSG